MKVLKIYLLLNIALLTNACKPIQYWKQRCGDVDFHWMTQKTKISDDEEPRCECGNVPDLYKDNFRGWRCLNSTSKCIGKGNFTSFKNGMALFLVGADKSQAWTHGVHCPDGVPTRLHNSCYGRCNYDPQNHHRSPVSTIAACKDTSKCVKETTWHRDKLEKGTGIEQRVCNGQFRCKDKGDFEWCKSEERRSELCPMLNNKVLRDCSHGKCGHDPLRCTGRFPGQCIEPKVKSVKTFFSCLDRSDLNPFSLKKQKQDLAFERIENCERRVNKSDLRIGVTPRDRGVRSWLTFGLSDKSIKPRQQDTAITSPFITSAEGFFN